MTEYLNGHGVRAITAWPCESRRRLEGPVAAVSLRGCEAGPGGFRDYLGERYDPEAGVWRELYGRKVRVTFGLDFYAPRESGAAGCQAAFDALADALNGDGPAGLKLGELSRGEVVFDQGAGLFRCPAEAVCDAYLYAVAEEGGAFLEFEVKGYGNDGP